MFDIQYAKFTTINQIYTSQHKVMNIFTKSFVRIWSHIKFICYNAIYHAYWYKRLQDYQREMTASGMFLSYSLGIGTLIFLIECHCGLFKPTGYRFDPALRGIDILMDKPFFSITVTVQDFLGYVMAYMLFFARGRYKKIINKHNLFNRDTFLYRHCYALFATFGCIILLFSFILMTWLGSHR